MQKNNEIKRKTCVARCPLAVVLLTGIFSFAVAYDAVASDEDQGKESIERQQKIELQKFYAGKSGSMPTAPMAIQFYNDAVKFFEKGEYDLAREAVKESIDLESRNPLAWELWGEIENLQQDFEKAETYFKKSYLLNPAPRVRQKLEKLAKEKAVEKNLDSYDEEHFIIKYKRDNSVYEGFGLREILRESYRQVSQDFGYYFNHKTVVLFYDKAEFHELTGQEHWVGGLYDGKIRLPAYQKGYTQEDVRAIVTHEMTHAFVAVLSGMRAPAWIHEGLAQYEQNKVRPIPAWTNRSNARLSFNQIISEDLKGRAQNQLQMTLFYREAFKLTSFMVDRYKMYRIKEILGKFKEGKSTEEAVEEVLGISLQELEKEWHATVAES